MKFSKMVRGKKSAGTLDSWYSRFIRLRDTDENGICYCISCGKPGHPKNLECGHFEQRNQYSVRYFEQNNNAQCHYCNSWLKGNSGEYRVALDKKYGPGTADKIVAIASRKGKLKDYECKLLAKEYRVKTYVELKRTGIEKWW